MLEALKFFLRTRPKIETLSEDNVRSENAVLRKKSKLIACPFQFNTLYFSESPRFVFLVFSDQVTVTRFLFA